jgi:hypothetical protein
MRNPLPAALFPSLLSCLPLSAQETVHDVPPGREIRENKLLSPGLTDVWKLDVEADEVLWCIVESSSFDPLLELYDADNARLGKDDGQGTRSELWLRVPHKGPLQFRVQGFQGTGHYSFWLQRYRTESLASRGEARHTFGKERWWHYRVTLHQGDILVPTVSGDGRVTAVFDEERRGVPDDHGGFQARRTGDHYVRIEGAEGRTCDIDVQLARQRDLDPSAVDDVLPPHGLDVFYLRDLDAGSAWLLDLAMPEAQLEFDLREPPAPQPAFAWPGHLDKGGRRHRWFVARRDGEFAVLLRNRGGAPAPFRLTRTAQVATMQPGVPVTGKLALGEGDLRALGLAAGDLLRFRLASRAFDAQLTIWGPDGDVIVPAVDDRGPLDRDAEHTLLVPRSGNYRVLAFSNGGCGSGEYTLTADVLPVPDLRIGTRLELALANGGTSHVHLDLQAGQEVWLSVRSRAFDARLVVQAPDGNAAFRCDGGGQGGDVLTSYRASHTGVHTLLVQGSGGAGTCELRAIEP